MKQFIAYKANGQITKTGFCQNETFSSQGDYVMEGAANDATQYIKNGQVVDMPPKPDGEFEFHYQTETWRPNVDSQWSTIKSQRNQLLAASDWTQLPDVPLAAKEDWAEYRQALRDVTEQPDPFNIIWPNPPE
jgi:hypothetical protein